jgi:hypothetical protein
MLTLKSEFGVENINGDIIENKDTPEDRNKSFMDKLTAYMKD